MPCAMMHLMCAKNYNNTSDTAFYIGSVAPDCISDRYEKDKNHLRDQKENREVKLIETAKRLDTCDPYILGVILHLFTDMKWDNGRMKEHRDNYTGESWFHDYRFQISLISSYMFHHNDWAPGLWDEMCAIDASVYSKLPDLAPDRIHEYLKRNRIWHIQNDIGPSEAFPCDIVDSFCRETANEFREWLCLNGIKTE